MIERIEDIAIGYCKIDGKVGFVRKINYKNDVICFHASKGHGMTCEKFEKFRHRNYEVIKHP